MNLMNGLSEICKLASPETLEDNNIICLVINAIDNQGNCISRISGSFFDILATLDMMIDHIIKHSYGTLSRQRIIEYLQIYTDKKED